MPAISASAPGKVILCGEHSVVYGFPAIAIPVFQVQSRTAVFAMPGAAAGEVRVNAPAIGLLRKLNDMDPTDPLRQTIELVHEELGIDHFPSCEIRISSSIPAGSGLGSSASVTVATLRALSSFLGKPFNDSQVNRLAFEIEKLHHGTPSGIDNTVITYQKPVFYRKDFPIELLEVNAPMHLLIADSGVAASTAEAVRGVHFRWQKDKAAYDKIFTAIGNLVLSTRELLETGRLEGLGDLMNQNHRLLQELQVSNRELDQLVSVALTAGAKGAKLSGGGLGGNIIALVEKEQIESVTNALIAAGAAQVIHTQLPFVRGMK